MYGYKCDKCGVPVYIDPGEIRVCDACEEKMMEHVKQEPTKMIYRPNKQEVCHAS